MKFLQSSEEVRREYKNINQINGYKAKQQQTNKPQLISKTISSKFHRTISFLSPNLLCIANLL